MERRPAGKRSWTTVDGLPIPASEGWGSSTANQPAGPIIDAFGLELSSRTIHVSALSLVIQHGPERGWNWTTARPIRLPAPVLL
jgi:hypothetical protein